MGQLVRFVLWLVAGLAGLFVIAAVALYFFFDPNDFRGDISAAVKDRTGRDLVIEGDISLDFFPWLAIEVGATTLGDAPGFGDEPMARFDRARLRVKLMPLLLDREITVGTAIIEGLVLNLQENKHGVGNWEDLVADNEPQADNTESGGQSDIDITGIDFLHATVSYKDGASGAVYRLSDLAMKIGRISGMETLTIDGLTLDGTLEGIAAEPSRLRVATGGIEIQTVQQVIALQTLELEVLGIEIAADVEPFSYADGVEPVAVIQIAAFSPRKVMAQFGVEPPNTADPGVLSQVSISAKAQLTPTAFELSSATVKLDDTMLTGMLSVPRDSSGTYRFDLAADAIDLNRYMEPASESASGGDTASATVEIPADLIRPITARGKLRIGTVTLGDVILENVELGLNTNNGRLHLYPITADLFGGTYSGDVRIDVAGRISKLSVNEKIADVDLARLAKAMFGQENITGKINGAFSLSGKGEDMAAIQRSLAGKISFELNNGTYEGMDIWYELRRARALIKGEQAPEAVLPAKTEFSVVRATGVITDGIMRNDDLFAELPFMQITGKGQVDLAAATVDYNMTARILERPEFLRDATAAELDEFTKAVIPLKITGPLAAPSVRPDLEKLLRKRVEDEIKDRLKDTLRDLLGR
ncbi:MAG: AsmA family protein [Proteobacteria bacterium]|nr:AsmA family protein [Pseudomonadota bacterium]